MDNTTELAALTEALHAQGIPTTQCAKCGAPEVAALRYKCGSHWRMVDGEAEMYSTPQCNLIAGELNATRLLVMSAKQRKEPKLVRRMTTPATEDEAAEEWRVEVKKVRVMGAKKPRLKLIKP